MSRADDRTISYEQWGVEFFDLAINEQRVLGAVNTITGQPIELGPLGVGPGRIAKVRASGEIGEASATRDATDPISYRVQLPVSLDFEVDLQVEKQRFEAELLVPLRLTAVARPGVRIFIEATAPQGEEVQVDLHAQGMRASVLQRLGGVEAELRRIVAGYVRRELEKPHVRKARLIDVSGVIEKAWESLAPPARGDGAERP